MPTRIQIEDVKEYLDADECDAEDGDGDVSPPGSFNESLLVDSASNDLGMMLGHARALNKAQLIDAMPEKPVVDRLMYEWFNSSDPFLRESKLLSGLKSAY